MRACFEAVDVFSLSNFRLQHYRQSEVPIIKSIVSFNVSSIDMSYEVNDVKVSCGINCCATIQDGELQVLTLTSTPLARRRELTVADMIKRALRLTESDISLVAGILRFDADEVDLLLRQSGIHELDPSLMDVLLPQQIPETCDTDELAGDVAVGLSLRPRQQNGSAQPSRMSGGGPQRMGDGSHEGNYGSNLNGPRNGLARKNSTSSHIISSLAAFSQSLNSVELVSNMRDPAIDISAHSSWAASSSEPTLEINGNPNASNGDMSTSNEPGLSVGYVGEKLVRNLSLLCS